MSKRQATNDSLLTVARLAERWDVSVSQVYALVQRGELIGRRIGGALRFRPADVAAYEDARATVRPSQVRKPRPPSGDGVDFEAARKALQAACRAGRA